MTHVEMAAQTNFTFLPAPFDKLGVAANLTLLDSNAPNQSADSPIPGLSDTTPMRRSITRPSAGASAAR